MKKSPLRQCTGCREIKDKSELIRVVKAPDGSISIDETGRKNGRGAYICRNPECLRKAMKNRGLEKSFRMPVPPDVYERLEEELRQSGEKR